MTAVIATVSPADASYSETLSTLTYAASVARISTRPSTTAHTPPESTAALIAELRAEVASLRNALALEKALHDGDGGGAGSGSLSKESSPQQEPSLALVPSPRVWAARAAVAAGVGIPGAAPGRNSSSPSDDAGGGRGGSPPTVTEYDRALRAAGGDPSSSPPLLRGGDVLEEGGALHASVRTGSPRAQPLAALASVR